MKRFFFFIALCLFVTILFPKSVLANVGVGVGTGKIVVEEKLRAGEIYNLPPFTVLNTGDEGSRYSVTIATREKQTEKKPSKEWFSFKPNEFYLNPGEAKTISVKLNVPVKTVPGDYFCFVEGYPIQNDKAGEASIGIAAAAKLYFTITPSNVLQGIYYRTVSLWKQYLPWTNIAAGVVIVYIIINILRKNINIHVDFKKKQTDDKNNQENAE